MRTTTNTNDGAHRTGGIVRAIRDGHAARQQRLLGLGLALCAGVLTNSSWAVSVSLTAPSNSVIAAPATITLTAAATAAAGRRILRVDFFQGTSRIGADTSAPYGIIWSNVPRGTYILTATAIDSGGSVAVSNPVVIRVDTPPTVSLKSPANNAVFAPGSSIPLTASAADADEIVTKVEFFSGGALLGTQFLPPYNITWNNVPAGRYTLTARATDLVGLTTTSAPVTITVDSPPTVAITSPANNALFVAPATVTVSAIAVDADGGVTQVEFFDGATLVGTELNTPGSPTYSVTLANLAAGTHTLTARATDNQGATTTSAAVTITVNLGVAQLYYIHPDHLNTPRLIADSTGRTVWRWDQGEPFGNDVPNNNPSGVGAFDFPLRFPGQYLDRETNLAYNYFRDYDSGIGRYVQSDLIGLKGGVSTYSFAIENPMQHVDLLGLHVSFCYYPKGWTHIGFAVEGEVETQGFYPAHPKLPFDLKGKIALDPTDEPRECKTVLTTPDQDRCLVNCRKRRADNPGTYNGATRQCTDFVRDCALECHVPIGNNVGPLPSWFFKGIPESNLNQ